MRVLSLHQPWAFFVVCGIKRWETRSRPAGCFGPLLIHATLRVCPVGREVYGRVADLLRLVSAPRFDELPRGAIVGRVGFTACASTELVRPNEINRMLGDFSAGRYAYLFRNAVEFEQPTPAKGHQGWWSFREENLRS